jgi:hypothetical protein
MGNAAFNKGRGGRKEGTHTTKGAFVVRPERLLRIVAPDLTACPLKPYVHTATRPPPKGERVPDWNAVAAKLNAPLR